MHPRIRFFITGFLIAGCIAVGAPPPVFAQDTLPIPKEQLQELQAIVKIQNAGEQINALGRFLAIYPETPLRADVYRLQFLSRKTLTGNDDELWNVGRRFVEAVTVLVEGLDRLTVKVAVPASSLTLTSLMLSCGSPSLSTICVTLLPVPMTRFSKPPPGAAGRLIETL